MESTVSIVVLLVALAYIARLLYRAHKRNIVLIQDSKMYLHKRGGTLLVSNANPYHLFSLDFGKNWYALNTQGEIIGKTEEVHPGLLAHLSAMGELIKFVEVNGPIDVRRITPTQMSLLERVGISKA